jgi:hypothetical protein
MADIQSPRKPLTIHLPVELITELETLAREKELTIDDVVMEACEDYTEPYFWERHYVEWRRSHPGAGKEFGIDGNELFPPAPSGEEQ